MPGLDLVVDSRVPLGAGLSSSAALECAVAIAVAASVGADVDDDLRSALVAACMRAEREVAGAPTGGMDQTVALFAPPGVGAAARLPRLVDAGRCRWDPTAAGLTLLVVDTRASHSLSDGGYQSRRAGLRDRGRHSSASRCCATWTDQGAALAALEDATVRRRVRHVFTEIDRVRQAVGAARGRRLRGPRRAVHGLARVPARRLRGLLRGAGRRRGHRAGARCPRRPDDRRRVRRLGDRAGARRPRRRGRAGRARGVRGAGVDGRRRS